MPDHYIGMDPGLHGAVAVIAVAKGAKPALAWCSDLPIITRIVGSNGKKRSRHDVPALASLLNSLTVWDPVRVVIEDVQGRGGQVGGAQLSYCVGLLHMGCEQAGLFVETVAPTKWKGAIRVPRDKVSAHKMAMNVIEAADPAWCTGPQGGVLDGRAEAALLAYWGWRDGRGGRPT
jgi:hypothetical protein